MDNLPNELLIEIFQYFLKYNLYNVALTCKRFNEIVSNTSTIMDQFYLQISDDKSIFMTNRKYRRINIDVIDEEVVKLMQHIGDSIVDIWIDSQDFYLNDLKKTLIACPNLKKLHMYNNVERQNGDFNEPLPRLQLDVLHIGNCNEILTDLMECSVKKLYADFYQSNFNSDNLKCFIKKQKQLEWLQIHNYADIFNDEALVDVEFRLKTFKIYSRSINNVENFRKFLQQQKSLHEMIIFNRFGSFTEAMNVLRHFRNVKKLQLEDVDFDFKPMHFVDNLTFYSPSTDDYRKFHELFPNATSLTLNEGECIKVVENFVDANRYEIKIPNVKDLTMKAVCFKGECPFEYENIKFEHLTFDCCDKMDWLCEWLKSNQIKLKSLRILNTYASDEMKEYFESLTRGSNRRIDLFEYR